MKGAAASSGVASAPVALSVGPNTITVLATAENGTNNANEALARVQGAVWLDTNANGLRNTGAGVACAPSMS